MACNVRQTLDREANLTLEIDYLLSEMRFKIDKECRQVMVTDSVRPKRLLDGTNEAGVSSQAGKL